MIDIVSIASQVKHNCNISDARYWGYYSPCGLLLRMRNLYKFEKKLKPWEKVSHADIGKWIDKREELWQELDSHDFRKIEIQGKQYNPFDAKDINSILGKYGYIYGAGYGNQLKPVFLLAQLSEKSKKSRYNIYLLGKEIARDLSTAPAMILGNTITLRHETMNLFFWDKFEEMKARKCNGALHHAFLEYSVSRDAEHTMSREKLEKHIEKIVNEEIATYIYHELGEASQRRVLGRWWKQLLSQLSYSRAELFLRALKDVLSDTCRSGMLSYIIKNKKSGSLGFYMALLGGYRQNIFPDILPAYSEFMKTNNWNLIEKARNEGYKKAGGYVRCLKAMFDNGNISQEAIEQELIQS
jgi:hypothetical protein